MLYCCVFSEYFSQDLFEVTYIDVIFLLFLFFSFLLLYIHVLVLLLYSPRKDKAMQICPLQQPFRAWCGCITWFTLALNVHSFLVLVSFLMVEV